MAENEKKLTRVERVAKRRKAERKAARAAAKFQVRILGLIGVTAVGMFISPPLTYLSGAGIMGLSAFRRFDEASAGRFLMAGGAIYLSYLALTSIFPLGRQK